MRIVTVLLEYKVEGDNSNAKVVISKEEENDHMLIGMMIFVVGEGVGGDVMTDEDSALHAEATVTAAQVTAVAGASVCRHGTCQLISRILGNIHF